MSVMIEADMFQLLAHHYHIKITIVTYKKLNNEHTFSISS